MIIRWLNEETFILVKLDSLVWQNKVVASRVIPYLVCRKIAFESKMQVLLDILESSTEELKQSSVEKVSKKNSLVNSLVYWVLIKKQISYLATTSDET